MEVNTIKDCFEARLLREIKPDPAKSRKSIEQAEERLKEAGRAINAGFFKYAIMESYAAMFHSSRAILYRDGIQEKSHYAIFVYLKEKYASKIPLFVINFLNIHRTERHEASYGLEYKTGKEDAITALDDAKEFVKEVGKIL